MVRASDSGPSELRDPISHVTPESGALTFPDDHFIHIAILHGPHRVLKPATGPRRFGDDVVVDVAIEHHTTFQARRESPLVSGASTGRTGWAVQSRRGWKGPFRGSLCSRTSTATFSRPPMLFELFHTTPSGVARESSFASRVDVRAGFPWRRILSTLPSPSGCAGARQAGSKSGPPVLHRKSCALG